MRQGGSAGVCVCWQVQVQIANEDAVRFAGGVVDGVAMHQGCQCGVRDNPVWAPHLCTGMQSNSGDWETGGEVKGSQGASGLPSAARAAAWPAPQHGAQSAIVLCRIGSGRRSSRHAQTEDGLSKGNLQVSCALMHTAALHGARHI